MGLGYLDAERRGCWGFRVQDCFGDSGLTGVLSLESNGGDALRDRLHPKLPGDGSPHREGHAAGRGGVGREAPFGQRHRAVPPTAKNMPCLAFLRDSGFREKGDGMFTWYATEPYEGSALFRVIRPASQAATQDQPAASLAGTHG